MKIYWPTVDRTHRVADYYDSFQQAVAQKAQVTFCRRTLETEAGLWTWQHVRKGAPVKRLLDPTIVNQYDVLFTDSIWAFLTEEWHSIKIPKYLMVVDQHGESVQSYTFKAHGEFGFDAYFTRYRDSLRKYLPFCHDRPVFWLPLSINPSVFRDYEEATRDICLLTGQAGWAYPFRRDASKALANTPWFEQIRRPPEHTEGAWPVGEDYARELNKARIGLACTSTYHYPVKKLFEIMACKSLLLCDDRTEMRDLGFVDGQNYLAYKSVDHIESLASRFLHPDLHDRADAIAQAGYNLVHTRHTDDIRAAQLLDMITTQQKIERF